MTEAQRIERDRLLATRSTKALWNAGYRTLRATGEWLPRDEVVQAVQAENALRASLGRKPVK